MRGNPSEGGRAQVGARLRVSSQVELARQCHRQMIIFAETIAYKYGAILPAKRLSVWNGICGGHMGNGIGRIAGKGEDSPPPQPLAELQESGRRKHILSGRSLAQKVDVEI